MPKERPSTAIGPLSVATPDLIADVQAMAGHSIRIDEALLDAAKRGLVSEHPPGVPIGPDFMGAMVSAP